MGYTNAEKQARWRQRHKQRNDVVAAELAQAKTLIAELEDEVGLLKIKQTVANVCIKELRRQHNRKMGPKTYRTIAKALHPDREPSTTEREHACKLFNAFCDQGKEKSRRRRT